ncbi:MAG: glycerol kinase GlpK [Planctomycetota bacterium]
MSAAQFLLALDQGTTSTRALLFDAEGVLHGVAQRELPQSYPQPGWVEHDAERIAEDALTVCREVLAHAGLRAEQVAAMGLSNQRETVLLWERATGRPIHPAIVWQDRRTAAACDALRAAGHEPLVQQRTGLLLDPYFTASKIAWLLEHVPGARARAAAGELACGTIDSFLIDRLTRRPTGAGAAASRAGTVGRQSAGAPHGALHLTDATNASRTALFDIVRQDWDEELLALFGVPRALLPQVRDTAGDFGTTDSAHFGAPIRIAAAVGDQQAAAIGQACWEPGGLKCTYGTGAFALLNVGSRPPRSQHRLLSTVAYRIDGQTRYALEGSIFSAGATVQWLRDGLQLFRDAAESEALARRADSRRRVHLVPAFVGLGAPHWDAEARGAVLGLTRDATAADITAAALQAVGFQTRELLQAMAADGAPAPAALRVDGGLAHNGYAMQFLADILNLPVERPALVETTALGAALLAGQQVGLVPRPAELARRWQCERRFEPTMTAAEREERWGGWQAAVSRVLSRQGG